MAHADLDRLLDFCLRFAQDMLKKHGGFHPFAAKVDPGGELNPLASYSGDEHPQSVELIGQLTEILKSLTLTGEAQAVAICYDGRVSTQGEGGPKQDAIAVTLEHSNGECVTVFLPYRKRFLRGYGYDQLIARAREREFFV